MDAQVDWNAPTAKPVQDIVDAVRRADEEFAAIPNCAFQRFARALMQAALLALMLHGPRATLGARLEVLLDSARESLAQWRREAGFYAGAAKAPSVSAGGASFHCRATVRRREPTLRACL